MRNNKIWTDLLAVRAVKEVKNGVTVMDDIALFLSSRFTGHAVCIGTCKNSDASKLIFVGVNRTPQAVVLYAVHSLFMPISEAPLLRRSVFGSDVDHETATLECAYDVVREFWQTKYSVIVNRLREQVRNYEAEDY